MEVLRRSFQTPPASGLRPVALLAVTLLSFVLGLPCASCGGGSARPAGPDAGGQTPDAGVGPGFDCAKGRVLCQGSIARTCDGEGGFEQTQDCAELGRACISSRPSSSGEVLPLGCVVCTPGEQSCQDGRGQYCPEDGSGFRSFDCDAVQGMRCEPDGCKGACAPPTVSSSYIGCDYYPTVTLNPVWRGFDFAVAVSNAGSRPANVLVTRGDEEVAQVRVEMDTLELIKLPWVEALKGSDVDACQIAPPPGNSRLVKAGAYRVRSDTPVTLYQLSPLQYQLTEDDGSAPAECPVGTECPGGLVAECLSYSNDASILLPATSLSGDYTVMSWPSYQNLASFFAITATEDATTVRLSGRGVFRQGGGVERDGSGEIGLDRGDVLQVVASHGMEPSDASGSRVHADKPVQVIGGQSCAKIPDEDTGECDHLEEAMFPSQILGQDYIVTYPAAVASKSPHVVRIAAIEAGTTVRFDPPIHEPLSLDPDDVPALVHVGDYTPGPPGQLGDEVEPMDVRITSDRPIVVSQYMRGQRGVPSGAGDPSMALAVPVEQYRTEYIFAAPTNYDANFINVIAPIGTIVELDGAELQELGIDVDTEYAVTRVELPKAGGGTHRIRADAPFGLLVYGYGRYTSYMVPGGLDLKRIAQIVPQ